MAEPISKVQRWLDLIAYLVGRRFPVAFEELMESLPAYARDYIEGSETARASVRRKFERDKDELRELGIPLETVTYTINYGAEEVQGYRIAKKDFYLPYLRLLEQEGGALPGRPPGAGVAHPDIKAPPDTFHLKRDEGEAGKFPRKRGAAEPGPLLDAPPGAAPGEEPPAPSGPPAAEEDLTTPFFHTTPDGHVLIEKGAFADAVWSLKEVSKVPGFPLSRAARSALRKFTFDLDPPSLSDSQVLFAEGPEMERAKEHLEALSDALLRRKRVTFTYHGIHRNETTEREVRPYGLLFKHSHWYLVGWDETRDAERIFRVDRMEEVAVNPSAPATPDYEMPDRPVLEAYRQREAWELGDAEEKVQARVWFRFPTSLWAERNGYGRLADEREDGATLREFEVRQPNAFFRWILSLEGEAVIESPPALREGLLAMAQQVADLYREDADG
jgi:predicted DNA-binding transcriptional regulator YafY